MKLQKYERFIAANQELRDFLRRAEELANGPGMVTEGDLKIILARLLNLAPEVGEASRSETLDTRLRDEVAEYVKNLRALQQTVEKIRCDLLTRRMQLEPSRRHLDGPQVWVHAHRQIA